VGLARFLRFCKG